MSEFEMPNLIENIVMQGVLSLTRDSENKLINFKNNREASGIIAAELAKAGLVDFEEGEGEIKIAYAKVLINGKEYNLEVEFIIDPATKKRHLKEISIKKING